MGRKSKAQIENEKRIALEKSLEVPFEGRLKVKEVKYSDTNKIIKYLGIYDDSKKRYVDWAKYVIDNFDDDDNDHHVMLSEMAGDLDKEEDGSLCPSSMDYYVEVLDYKEELNGEYNVKMTVEGTLYPWKGTYDVVLSSEGKILKKTKSI